MQTLIEARLLRHRINREARGAEVDEGRYSRCDERAYVFGVDHSRPVIETTTVEWVKPIKGSYEAPPPRMYATVWSLRVAY